MTREEARLLSAAVPECATRIMAIENGVDSDYFSPAREFASPFEADDDPIVFTGAMDYWPNIDAVTWFAQSVLPRIRQRNAKARFYIVGMNPDRSVQALAQDPAVRVTGRVADVRPYLKHARAVVAPLRVARGIQNKVLEAMAMARPTVVTCGVARALSSRAGVDFEMADEPAAFADKVLAVMDPTCGEPMGRRARASVEATCAWERNLTAFDELLDTPASPHSASAEASFPAPQPMTASAR